jgi:ABC-type glycerol-3-phosphate transport system permease component
LFAAGGGSETRKHFDEERSAARFTRGLLVNGALALVVILWLIPRIGLSVSSFRERLDIHTSSWRGVLPHRDRMATETFYPRQLGLDANEPMTVEGVAATSRGIAIHHGVAETVTPLAFTAPADAPGYLKQTEEPSDKPGQPSRRI